ncbi:S8 family peptidase [Mycolicibacterium fluoranthenivorans]|jgi:serine protease AprX|uniref:S8 family peptidase n=1 Tax=Mycolicibacterium fluoranthenivorans TaxID=258505 RepID=A0A7G8PBD3_9MYCO|nr:S8 family peptidase [Mycolicibacterium fluoranthenivorans]QNJ91649.1 S8 family peptidase [Mycolicibacterium fluoranthenivorans]
MTPTQTDREQYRAARSYTKRVYGSDMAEKASDSFCLSVYQRTFGQPVARGLQPEALGVAGASPQPMPTVLEFEPSAALQALTEEPPTGGDRALDRAEAIQRVRTANYQVMSPVYTEIDRLSTTTVGLSPEFLGWPQIQSLVTQVCWLNRSVRTWAGPEALADVTADSAVTSIDIPRLLQPEAASVDHVAIKLPDFVERTGLTGHGVTVAVIDSEVAAMHPALAGRVVQRRNYTAEPWGNPGTHGTAVAGLIAADDQVNGGIAPGVTVYNYKVLATNRFLHADDHAGALAIQQALEDGAAVANCSWGAGAITKTKSREAIAVDSAWALGMLVVKSAGNDGPRRSTMTTPADADGVIVVGATDLGGMLVGDYSSRGPALRRTRPHLIAPGGEPDGARLSCCLTAGGFGDAGYGTSYAAPQVTGAIALLLQQNPQMKPDDIRKHLLRSARKLPGFAPNDQGHGLLQLT